MLRVGITGQAGFVGTHLFHTLKLFPEAFTCVPFEDAYFDSDEKLQQFVSECDAIVHLAAVNRCPSEKELYETNLRLVTKLIVAMEKQHVTPHVLFSSSTQEQQDTIYGQSKREGRLMLEAWAQRSGGRFTGLVIPNVYGPFGKAFYNSVVATFAHQVNRGQVPEVKVDASLKLIYVGSLCQFILDLLRTPGDTSCVQVPFDCEWKVSEILKHFRVFHDLYIGKGAIPHLKDRNEVNLFNTFRSYCDIEGMNPVELVKCSDARGSFVETIRLGVGGQVSFSTTVPGVTRGNHYHTRKIERFAVIKGRARIQLRQIGTDHVLEFDLNGEKPAFVDMPVWYTHNITNTGDDELYTLFWINEWYDPNDGDTYYEKV